MKSLRSSPAFQLSDFGTLDYRLTKAISQQNPQLIKSLLNQKANVNDKNEYGLSPLHNAVLLENKQIVDLLILHKADLNIQNCRDNTPLHMAVAIGNSQMLHLLIKKQAKINLQNNFGNTPLHVAVRKGHPNLVELLIKYNADITICNYRKETILHILEHTNLENTVKLLKILLQTDINPNIKNFYGQIPIKILCNKYGNELQHLSANYWDYDRGPLLQELHENMIALAIQGEGYGLNLAQYFDYIPGLKEQIRYNYIIKSAVFGLPRQQNILDQSVNAEHNIDSNNSGITINNSNQDTISESLILPKTGFSAVIIGNNDDIPDSNLFSD
ncbi:MAG: ankyrin repeat domain-containing protein [Rickettsiaceae bacterium]|nr:ankyrin repeat domain-containing protein [Rickettsiaceae bacterium]